MTAVRTPIATITPTLIGNFHEPMSVYPRVFEDSFLKQLVNLTLCIPKATSCSPFASQHEMIVRI